MKDIFLETKKLLFKNIPTHSNEQLATLLEHLRQITRQL